MKFADSVDPRIARGLRTADDWWEYAQSRVSRRRFLQGLGVAGAAVAAGPTLWTRTASANEPPRGLHLSFGDDPQTSMNISWFTASVPARVRVEFGETTQYGTSIDADTVTYANPVDPPTTHQHHVSLVGLAPATTYHYRVYNGDQVTADRTFTTAPATPEKFTFTAFGDHGSDPGVNVSRASWGTAFSPVAVQRLAAVNPRFHVHAGDLSYSCGGPQSAWDAWLTQIDPVAGSIPWMATLGNHEMELGFGPQGYDGFRSRFRLPGNGIETREEWSSTYYAFRYSNVAVVALDGNEAASESGYDANQGYLNGVQDAWIDATLGALRADPKVDFIVVSFHNCMYCTDVVHGSDGGCRARWQPLFEKHQVDIVFNGHNHCYERTHPIKGTDFTATREVDPARHGVVYFCVGGGGQLTARSASSWPLGIIHDEGGQRGHENALWRASRFEGYSMAVVESDPGVPGGTARLTVRAHEFSTPLFKEVDSVTILRPARAVSAS